jgi:glucose/arabinose dehydrogenase
VGNPCSSYFQTTAASQLPRAFVALFVIALGLILPGGHAADIVDWPTLVVSEVVTNQFQKPTCLVSAADGTGRFFVGEQGGKIWIIRNGKLEPTPFFDLSTKVTTAGPEQGLLGLTFPPDFASKQYFYVYYTVAAAETYQPKHNFIVVSRFHVSLDPNVAGLRTEELILTLPKDEDYHNGGQLAFGPDGFLYIGVGDGGPQGDPNNRAQDLTSRFGKILRIDVESGAKPYAIPATNPFVGNTNALPEIWAHGLRNPWRFSFDRLTGDLYIGDVGQWAFEEVDFQPANSRGGENYGWRITEGPANYTVPAGFTNFAALTQPIATYDHLMMGGDGGQGSVTGGFVYRGPDAGRMQGMYVYGDFMGGWLWGLKKVNGAWMNNVLRAPPEFSMAMSTFGEDDHGRLFIANYNSGKIYEVSDSGQVWRPEFSPPRGAIPTDKLIVTCPTPNAEIHYTTDGRDPGSHDPIVPPDGVITIRDSDLVTARAFRNDLLPSNPRSAEFRFQTGPPLFSPTNTTQVLSNTLVTLSSATPGATLYYTTNGYMPAPNDTSNTFVYTKPFTLTAPLNLHAIAIAPGFATSEVRFASYGIAASQRPRVSPDGGFVTNGMLISLSCSTPGAAIYWSYALGPYSSPTRLYTGPFSIPTTAGSPTSVYAYSVAPGYAASDAGWATFYAERTATPVIDPPSSFTTLPEQFTISCETPGATIHYTLDGNDPWYASTSYSGPVKVANSVTVKAIGVAPGKEPSAIATTYYIKPQMFTPTFDPPSGPLTNGATITISSWFMPSGAVLRYTVDGSEPNGSSPIYTGPIKFTGPMILKAAAEAPGYAPGYPNFVLTSSYAQANYEHSIVTTWAGSTNRGNIDGPRLQARFEYPTDICIDSKGAFYVMDAAEHGALRKITADGMVTTVVSGIFSYYGAQYICVDSADNVYVSDYGNCNRIWKISPTGSVSTFAEISSCQPGYAPPFDINAICFGPDGDLYYGGDEALQKTNPDGSTATLQYFSSDQWGSVVVPVVDPSTNVFLASINAVWLASPTGKTTVFAGGTNGTIVPNDGALAKATFDYLNGMARTPEGDLIVSDRHRIRRITANTVTTVAGEDYPYSDFTFRNGPGETARLWGGALCVDANGNIYVADSENRCIRKISKDSAAIGIPDEWQLANFGKVGIDPDGDDDGDGVSNRVEFWTGTNPKDPSSALALKVSRSDALNGPLEFRWPTVGNKVYQLQFSEDLIEWSDFGARIVGDGSVATIIDATLPDRDARWFYRIAIED